MFQKFCKREAIGKLAKHIARGWAYRRPPSLDAASNSVIHVYRIMSGQGAHRHRCNGSTTRCHEFPEVLSMEDMRKGVSDQEPNVFSFFRYT